MADETSTKTEDTIISEESTTKEETQDTEVIDLEDDDTSFEEYNDDTEESEEENKEDSTASEEESSEEESEEEDTSPSKEEEEVNTKIEAPSPEELAKQAFEARRAERQARAEAEAIRKQATEANIERYLEEAGDDEAEKERRILDVENYRLKEERVNLNQDRLETELARAVANIDLFNNGTPAVKNQLLRAVDNFEATSIVKDKHGRPLEIRGNLYQYLQQEANSIRELIGDGARLQDNAKTKQKSRTLTTPTKSVKKVKDDLLDGFDEEAGRW